MRKLTATVVILGLVVFFGFIWFFGGFRWMDQYQYESIGSYYTAQEARYHKGPPPPFNPNARLSTGRTLKRTEGGPSVSVPPGTPVEEFATGEVRIVLKNNDGAVWFDRTFVPEEGE